MDSNQHNNGLPAPQLSGNVADVPVSSTPAPTVVNQANDGPATQITQSPQHNSGVPTVAEDSDLIEKEWVFKAKQIVDQNRGNPNLQNQGIAQLKAQYIKKRYGKDLKQE